MNINLYEILVRNFSTPVNLETESRKSKFCIFSEDGKLFVHNNKDNIRPISFDEVDNFYKIFRETGSHSPSTYTDVTFNSSYSCSSILFKGKRLSLNTEYKKKPDILSGFFVLGV